MSRNLMRKSLAYLLIAATLWGSVILPARAVVPLLFPLAVGSVTTAEGTIALAAVASTVTVGSVITLIAMTDDGNAPATNGSNVAIQVQLDPYTPLTTPESAVGPATSPYTPVETVVSDLQLSWCYQQYCFSTPRAAADYYLSQPVAANYTETNFVEESSNFRWILVVNDSGSTYYIFIDGSNSCAPGSSWNGSDCVTVQNTCPSGYTFNGSTQSCNRNNIDVQIADNKTQINRQGNELSKNPNDLDPLPANVTVSPQEVVIKALDSKTNIKINPDGTSEIIVIERGPNNSTTESKIQVSAPTPGASPQVVGKQVSTIPGQENGLDGEPVSPGTGSGSPTPAAAGTTVLNLPENLAKTEKQCGYDAAHPCKVKVDEEGTPSEFDNAGRESALDGKFDELQAFIDSQENGVGSGLENPLIGKVPSGQCTDPVYDVTEVHANAHATIPICAHMADLEPWTSFAAYVASALAIYGIWFRRLGGAS